MVYLYFYSKTCGPCRALKDRTDVLAAVRNKLHNNPFIKVDVEESPKLANQCGVKRLPSIATCIKDRVVDFAGPEQVVGKLNQIERSINER